MSESPKDNYTKVLEFFEGDAKKASLLGHEKLTQFIESALYGDAP